MGNQFSLGEELPSNFPELRARLVDLRLGFVVFVELCVCLANAVVGIDKLTGTLG